MKSRFMDTYNVNSGIEWKNKIWGGESYVLLGASVL